MTREVVHLNALAGKTQIEAARSLLSKARLRSCLRSAEISVVSEQHQCLNAREKSYQEISVEDSGQSACDNSSQPICTEADSTLSSH